MADAMLPELYRLVFITKSQAEAPTDGSNQESSDRRRQVAIEKNKMLSELIDIRTEQIRQGK